MRNEPAIMQRMRRHVARWQDVADRRVVFLHCYMLMTSNMLDALEAGEFVDGEWVNGLLIRFADYYFDALEIYERDREAAPAVWRVAHDATLGEHVLALQRLFLGVNAHINYDLVLALNDLLAPEWAQSDEALRQVRYRDHCYVNEVIARTVDSVQDTVIEQEEPQMDLVDKLMGPVDEWLTAWVIRRWRDDVWRNALHYMQAPEPEAQDRLRRHLEATTLQRAEAILQGRAADSVLWKPQEI